MLMSSTYPTNDSRARRRGPARPKTRPIRARAQPQPRPQREASANAAASPDRTLSRYRQLAAERARLQAELTHATESLEAMRAQLAERDAELAKSRSATDDALSASEAAAAAEAEARAELMASKAKSDQVESLTAQVPIDPDAAVATSPSARLLSRLP